jgi:hypothetical protein
LKITSFLSLCYAFSIIQLFRIQETATASPWSAHCVEMAWTVHIRLSTVKT